MLEDGDGMEVLQAMAARRPRSGNLRRRSLSRAQDQPAIAASRQGPARELP
jgi:hypothetical protein